MTHNLSLLTTLSRSTSKPMFGERDRFEREIRELLAVFSIEDALEEMDISPEEVLSILLNGGHCVVPDFIQMEPTEDE